MKFVESMNSTQVYCSQKKSTLTAKKKKEEEGRVYCMQLYCGFHAQNTNTEMQ